MTNEYADSTDRRYPVVFLLDANFFFPMVAPVLHQYEKAGLLPPLILVGIGYQSWMAMDSLRQRDYLFPAALPSDEITAEGGGQKFAQFLSQELIPRIDKTYRTQPNERTLAGHSFGGYFPLYALLYQLETQKNDYQNFIAASPTLWYHDFYINRLPEKLKQSTGVDSLNLFLSVGSKEDSTWFVKPLLEFSKAAESQNIHRVEVQVYNSLDHMDVGLLSFVKGLQAFYGNK